MNKAKKRNTFPHKDQSFQSFFLNFFEQANKLCIKLGLKIMLNWIIQFHLVGPTGTIFFRDRKNPVSVFEYSLDGCSTHTNVQPKVYFFRKFPEIQGRNFSIEGNYFDFLVNF